MNRLTVFFYLCVVLGVQFHAASAVKSVKLQNNAYEDVLIAIHPMVSEDATLIDKIKEIYTEASNDLFIATNRRAYFGTVTILVPSTWTTGAYQGAANLSYSNADTIITNFNNFEFGFDVPYTSRVGGCGEQGTYIHLTPQYILDDDLIQTLGPKGKTIVHEWAHYRWGVFDEVPSIGEEQFYRDSRNDLNAIQCPANFPGTPVSMDSKGNTGRCDPHQSNNLYEKDCRFFPLRNDSAPSVSLMAYQYVDSVIHFCNSSTHNIEAPNKQNQMCSRKSTWEIILQSKDFLNGVNPSVATNVNTTPRFQVSQQNAFRRHVLVLDVSGSMSGDRLRQMRQVVHLFITLLLPDNDAVAIIEFNSTSRVLLPLTRLESIAERNSLTSYIPNNAEGGTCIGCGITEAILTLESFTPDAAGGNVVVLTDGEETLSLAPVVSNVRDDVLNKNIILHSIFFGLTSGNQALQNLSEESGGTWYFGNDDNIENLLQSFFSQSVSTDGNPLNEAALIHSTTFDIFLDFVLDRSVTLDNTLGNQTTFSFALSNIDDVNDVYIRLESPSGCTYTTNPSMSGLCDDYESPDVSGEFKLIVFTIPGTARAGSWKYQVETNITEGNPQVTISVTSKPKSPSVAPIIVMPTLNTRIVGNNNVSVLVIYAQVTQDNLPVINATAIARIVKPDGSSETIRLFDGGAAPDITANDGVYSRFFTNFTAQGRYAVRITVTHDGMNVSINDSFANSTASPANINFGVTQPDGSVSLNAEAFTYLNRTARAANVEAFSRVVGSPGYQFTGIITAGTDVFPPSQINDLNVRQVLVNSSFMIALSFTAPGDDLDSGTAYFYETRYCIENLTLIIDNFEDCEIINSSQLAGGNFSNPQSAGQFEIFVFDPEIGDDTSTYQYSFAIRAHDESRNIAPQSNVATLLFPVSRISGQITSTTTTTTATTPVITIPTPPPDPIIPLALVIVLPIVGFLILLVLGILLYIFVPRKQRSDAYLA